MDELVPNILKCARCGRLATLVCKGCKTEDPTSGGLVATTKYCSASCQKADWHHHKALCKAIQAVREFQSLQLQRPELQGSDFRSDGVQTRELQSREPEPSEPHPRQVNADEAHKAPTQPDNPAHPCASCHHLTTEACKGCEAAPSSTEGLVASTYYCSPTCQTANRSLHEAACTAAQARRKLYEAGEALQKEYYGYCQTLVMTMLESGSLNRNHMILHESDAAPRTTDAIALLQTMPANSEDERAYLACLIGSGHTGEMGKAVKEQLKDLATEIRQVTLSLKTLRRRFIRQDWQAAKDKHRVLHVFLKNGEDYALDISGVQFGLRSPVTPWGRYVEEHVGQVEGWEGYV
ncbi:hypothetical protein HO173_008581 [Letharia columbiana]|uniref:MYND-type domain-containing protein n=1 Tax=Letharia columbiana TaxID=112416 RepID=A0A8H6L2N4_9LECA|nr:uncharacterized protein HO173_008581 [Letharia columbiana]KAF6233290.1 hypothetical protein HO173_008581 [Letharia columbiana]